MINCNRHVGGSIKADAKIEFTFMITTKLNASKIKDPFLVFTGAKMEDAKTEVSRLKTNNLRFSAWREDELGLLFVNFEKKH